MWLSLNIYIYRDGSVAIRHWIKRIYPNGYWWEWPAGYEFLAEGI